MIHLNRPSAVWTSTNPVLAANQIGIESDSRKIKYGDGATAWNALPYSELSYQETIVNITISDLQNSIPDFTSAYIVNNKQEGIFEYDPTSTEAAINGMIIITADGKRFKRVLNGGPLNILWFGADNTGVNHCTFEIRRARDYNTGKAASDGNSIYFPAGTYVTGPIDVLSNSQIFGDGMGATVIKALRNGSNLPKTIFALSNGNFDESGHYTGDIENVTIHDLTLDFNFIDPANPLLTKWVDFFCPILFKNDESTINNKTTNIRIYNVQFIDSAKAIHGDLIGKPAKDAWCINFGARHIEHVWIENCISLAESHQFVAGGLSVLKKIHVLNNHIEKPHANAITFTTVVHEGVVFEDFVVSGNIINDTFASTILFGHDPSPNLRAVGDQKFSRLQVTNNHIYIGNYNVYGTDYRNSSSFPYLLNIQGTSPAMKDVVFSNNTVYVPDDYQGNDIALKLDNFNYNRPTTTTTSSFVQPAINATVTIMVANNTHVGSAAFTPEDHITIYNGGLYEVVSSSGLSVVIKLLEMGGYAAEGDLVPADSVITFIGGRLENVTITNNAISRNQPLRINPTGLVKNLIVKLNNKIFFQQVYASSYVDEADLSYNTDFIFAKTKGSINGVIQGNTLLKTFNSNNGSIRVDNNVSALTNKDEVANLYIALNVILDTNAIKISGTGFKANGTLGAKGVLLAFNNFRDTKNRGIEPAVRGYLNNYGGAIGQGYTAPILRDIIATKNWAPVFTPNNVESTTITVIGAKVGDMVNLVVPLSAIHDYVIYSAYVSAVDTVTIKAVQIAGTPVLSAGTFEVKVTQK